MEALSRLSATFEDFRGQHGWFPTVRVVCLRYDSQDVAMDNYLMALAGAVLVALDSDPSS